MRVVRRDCISMPYAYPRERDIPDVQHVQDVQYEARFREHPQKAGEGGF